MMIPFQQQLGRLEGNSPRPYRLTRNERNQVGTIKNVVCITGPEILFIRLFLSHSLSHQRQVGTTIVANLKI